jgi:hypothetical protein
MYAKNAQVSLIHQFTVGQPPANNISAMIFNDEHLLAEVLKSDHKVPSMMKTAPS